MVHVQLSLDYSDELFEGFDPRPQSWWDRDPKKAADVSGGLYEVPAEQVARWDAAEDAWLAARAEIRALMEARAAERRAEREARERREAEAREREERRRAEIRRQLYGGRKQ
jgi:hypothetical protein